MTSLYVNSHNVAFNKKISTEKQIYLLKKICVFTLL